MSGNHSRRKGHQFEREVAIRLRSIFPNARRQLEYHVDDCRGVDLSHTGPYRVQCKKLKAYAPVSTIDEVQCDVLFGEVPIVVTAGDSLEPMAILPFSEFLRLVGNQK